MCYHYSSKAQHDGDEAGSRWAAKGMGVISICAKRAAGGESIDVRRRNIGATIIPHIAIAKIVSKDHYNVRELRLSSSSREKGQHTEQQNPVGGFHCLKL